MSDQGDHARPTLPRLEHGSVFAGYWIDRLIDRGGMGVVYKAMDVDLDRAVAARLPEAARRAAARRAQPRPPPGVTPAVEQRPGRTTRPRTCLRSSIQVKVFTLGGGHRVG